MPEMKISVLGLSCAPMNMKFLLSLVPIFSSLGIFAQTNTNTDSSHHNHDHHKNEIGVANAPVLFVKEKVFAYGLHLHYVRNILHSRFGIGLGFERIFDAHKHNTIGLVTLLRIPGWSLIVAPGLTFEDANPTAKFALHLESAYEFQIGHFHIGPSCEFAYDPEDIHLSLGLHLGYGF